MFAVIQPYALVYSDSIFHKEEKNTIVVDYSNIKRLIQNGYPYPHRFSQWQIQVYNAENDGRIPEYTSSVGP